MVPSPKVATYDLQPEMSVQAVADTVAKVVESNEHDFVMCNFAPPDMVRRVSSIQHNKYRARLGRPHGGLRRRRQSDRRDRRGRGHRVRCMPARGVRPARHRGPRERRADAQRGDRRAAHGAHVQPRAVHPRRARGLQGCVHGTPSRTTRTARSRGRCAMSRRRCWI